MTDPGGWASVDCPYCGERISVTVDDGALGQDYIEDCAVCCRPIEIRLRAEAGAVFVEVRREDD